MCFITPPSELLRFSLFEFGEYIQLGAIYDDGLALNNVRSINTMSSSNDREFFLNALDTFEFEGIASKQLLHDA